MKKLFGGLDLTWKKLIIWAIIAGVYTGVTTLIPGTMDTSIRDISISFEWWILFGIIIIMNSKTPVESAMKCFVFFLISQPLVYLVQVPFHEMGWELFGYYKPWFIWTLFTIPMGFIGNYMKQDKWWGLLILTPMLAFLGFHYHGFLSEARSFFPNHLLSAIFCAVTMIIYPLAIFNDKKVRYAGLAISLTIIVAMTILATAERSFYSTDILFSGGSLGAEFDETYTAYLADSEYGELSIRYEEALESYMIHADFAKTGETQIIIEDPDGAKQVFDIVIYRSSYEITKPISGS